MNYMMIHDISPLLTLIKKCSLYVCGKCYFFFKKKTLQGEHLPKTET